jgi:hypothetical protein
MNNEIRIGVYPRESAAEYAFFSRLMNVRLDALACDQFVENRQHLLAVMVGAMQPGLDAELIAVPLEQLVEQLAGDVDIAAQGVGGVAAQKESIEHRGLALRGQRVKIVQ